MSHWVSLLKVLFFCTMLKSLNSASFGSNWNASPVSLGFQVFKFDTTKNQLYNDMNYLHLQHLFKSHQIHWPRSKLHKWCHHDAIFCNQFNLIYKDIHLIFHSLDLATSQKNWTFSHSYTRSDTLTQDGTKIKGSSSGNLPWMQVNERGLH